MTDREQPQKEDRFNLRGLVITLVGSLTVFGGLAFFTVGKDLLAEKLAADRIPACDSAQVRELLTGMVSNASNAFQTRVFIDFTEIVERSHEPGVKRVCAGKLTDSEATSQIGLELTLNSIGDIVASPVPDPGPTFIQTATPTPPQGLAALPTSANDTEGQKGQLPPDALNRFLATPTPATLSAMFGPSDDAGTGAPEYPFAVLSWQQPGFTVTSMGDGKRITDLSISVANDEGEAKSQQKLNLLALGPVVLGQTKLKGLGQPASLDPESLAANAMYPARALYIRAGHEIEVQCIGWREEDGVLDTSAKVSGSWSRAGECLIVGATVKLR